jgi:hypothetical protein
MTLSFQNKNIELRLPSKISELRHSIWRSPLFLKAIMAMDDILIRMSVIEHETPNTFYKHMSPQHISQVLHHWTMDYDWKDIPPAPAWKYIHLNYVAPPEDFRTGTLREFIYLDEYLTAGDTLSLTALLYRRKCKDVMDAFKREDMRERLISRDQVTAWAAILKRYVHKEGVQIMIAGAHVYAISIKSLIHDIYGQRLFGGDQTVSHNLGWTATAMQIAEQGVFGGYEQVLDTTLHEILAYMLVKKSESDAMEAQMKK